MGLKVMMDKPADVCPGFDQSKFVFDFSTMEFDQMDDDRYHIGGSMTIKETIAAPIKVRAYVTSIYLTSSTGRLNKLLSLLQVIVKSSRSVNGLWMPGLINKVYTDICAEIKNPTETTKWTEGLKPLTKDGSCPFEKVSPSCRQSEFTPMTIRRFLQGTHNYDDLEFDFVSKLTENIPRSLYGKWRAQVRFEKDGTVLSCNYFYFSFV